MPLPLVHGLEFFVVQKIIVVVATGTGIDADTGIAPIRPGRPARLWMSVSNREKKRSELEEESNHRR